MSTFAITHEIGAANLLYPYLAAEFPDSYCISTGPSDHLPTQYGLKKIQISDVPRLLSLKENTIFLGATASNLASTVVPTLRCFDTVQCKKILVLDNWVNYQSRISRVALDSVIVFDEYAYKYASQIFCKSSVEILQIKNYFLEICNQKYKKPKKSNKILFIEVPFNSFTSYTKSDSYSYCICFQLNQLCEKFRHMQVNYRKHPSGMGTDCFMKFGVNFPHFAHRIELSENSDLLDDFANSEFVVGLPSYALYLAQKLGIRVFSAESTNAEWHGPLFEPLSSIC